MVKFWQSQNHVHWQEPPGIIQSTPPVKSCHLELTAQDCDQSDFEYRHRWRLHYLYGKPIPVFDHLHNRKAL